MPHHYYLYKVRYNILLVDLYRKIGMMGLMNQVQRKILIVEDDPEINTLLSAILNKNNMKTTSAYSGTEAKLLLENNTYDLILIDLMLPGISGETLIAEIREDSAVPIIVISAKVDVAHKVDILKSGADDYITKPFNQEEVLARIEVQFRKSTLVERSEQAWRALQLDSEKRLISLNEQTLDLTNAEFDILSLFIQQPEHAFSKREIYERIWTGPYVGDDNTISVHVSNIRRKIATITRDEYIKTIWGIGFMLV